MESNKRACFAFIAASLVNKLIYHRVVEQETAQSYNIKAYDVTTNAPHFYDQNRGGQVRSSGIGFYDTFSGTNVITKVIGNEVHCNDHETGFRVIFKVNGQNVHAHDHQTGARHDYKVH